MLNGLTGNEGANDPTANQGQQEQGQAEGSEGLQQDDGDIESMVNDFFSNNDITESQEEGTDLGVKTPEADSQPDSQVGSQAGSQPDNQAASQPDSQATSPSDEFLIKQYGTTDIEYISAAKVVHQQKAEMQQVIDVAYQKEVNDILTLKNAIQSRYDEKRLSEVDYLKAMAQLEVDLRAKDTLKAEAEKYNFSKIDEEFHNWNAGRSQKKVIDVFNQHIEGLKTRTDIPEEEKPVATKVFQELLNEMNDPKFTNMAFPDLLKHRETQILEAVRAGREIEKAAQTKAKAMQRATSRLGTLATKSTSAPASSPGLTNEKIMSMSDAEKDKNMSAIVDHFLAKVKLNG